MAHGAILPETVSSDGARSFAAIVVAAGKGLRASQPLPKQFADWQGKPLVRHSVEAFALAGAAPIIVAIPQDGDALASAALDGIPNVQLVIGGATRQNSVALALEQLNQNAPDFVLIHDAARPTVPQAIIARLLDALCNSGGAIPVLPVVDSLSVDENGQMAGSADRESLRRVQTPQAFNYAEILAAHRGWQGDASAGDDAQVFLANGGRVTHVEGDEIMKKLTFAEDFLTVQPSVRTGLGYDVHRLVAGEELWLGGIKIDHSKGLSGHSDADVALHALVDALLGAIGAGDIGEHFPPSSDQWKGAASSKFVEHAAGLVAVAGYRIGNVDLTIICEEPKIGPHRDAMRAEVARLLGVDIAQVSVKATTTERLGFTGRSEGIAAQAIATVLKGQ
ncbi:MAG: bifunctional 2-C-methyl-D-erythritol 4-phosphate cytidylyltransferase/2-C-methyl-D-erythritol 2,4-cyclodiphosphate synthase [Pontixanthobacter sp.]